jgi:hypothetical protein
LCRFNWGHAHGSRAGQHDSRIGANRQIKELLFERDDVLWPGVDPKEQANAEAMAKKQRALQRRMREAGSVPV